MFSEKTYFHSGSSSQPAGNPIAETSTSENEVSNVWTFSFMSLPGEIVFRKYLMMHRLK